jgi:hypothetical protein
MKSDAWLDEVCGGYPGDFGPNPTWRSTFPTVATAWDAAADLGSTAWYMAKEAVRDYWPTSDTSIEPPHAQEIPDIAADVIEE